MSSIAITDIGRVIPEILDVWRGHLRASRDCEPRSGARGAAETALVSALLRAALASDGDEGPIRGLVVAAVTYGSTERIRRLDPGEICEELGALREAIWAHAREASPGPDAGRFILRIDQAISIASTAVLHGGYSCATRPSPA